MTIGINRMLKRASLFFVLLAFWACGNNAVYNNYMAMPEQGWAADSIAQFDVEIKDTSAMFGVFLKMRHNGNYPYRNIWFFRRVISENGVEYTDTINYILADEMGKWKGSGIGELKHVVMPFKKEALRFNKPGVYTFEIQHGMKDTVLEGITELGLEVLSQKTEQ